VLGLPIPEESRRTHSEAVKAIFSEAADKLRTAKTEVLKMPSHLRSEADKMASATKFDEQISAVEALSSALDAYTNLSIEEYPAEIRMTSWIARQTALPEKVARWLTGPRLVNGNWEPG
jgi:hypothetical protein